jgi:hypothetical protein
MIYLPYLMYFNQPNFRSATINTDQFGFRMSHGPSGRASVGGDRLDGPFRLLVGGSGSLGYGATNDGATLASRLWMSAPSRPWLNFGAPYFNSTQELMLFVLYRQLALLYRSFGVKAVRLTFEVAVGRQPVIPACEPTAVAFEYQILPPVGDWRLASWGHIADLAERPEILSVVLHAAPGDGVDWRMGSLGTLGVISGTADRAVCRPRRRLPNTGRTWTGSMAPRRVHVPDWRDRQPTQGCQRMAAGCAEPALIGRLRPAAGLVRGGGRRARNRRLRSRAAAFAPLLGKESMP